MKSFIDGYTFNMQNGALVKTKLENSQIYAEEIVQGFELYKVFFPDVKPGSVIDLEYSHAGLPFEWRFQDIIPVVFNELLVERTTEKILVKHAGPKAVKVMAALRVGQETFSQA